MLWVCRSTGAALAQTAGQCVALVSLWGPWGPGMLSSWVAAGMSGKGCRLGTLQSWHVNMFLFDVFSLHTPICSTQVLTHRLSGATPTISGVPVSSPLVPQPLWDSWPSISLIPHCVTFHAPQNHLPHWDSTSYRPGEEKFKTKLPGSHTAQAPTLGISELPSSRARFWSLSAWLLGRPWTAPAQADPGCLPLQT